MAQISNGSCATNTHSAVPLSGSASRRNTATLVFLAVCVSMCISTNYELTGSLGRGHGPAAQSLAALSGCTGSVSAWQPEVAGMEGLLPFISERGGQQYGRGGGGQIIPKSTSDRWASEGHARGAGSGGHPPRSKRCCQAHAHEHARAHTLRRTHPRTHTRRFGPASLCPKSRTCVSRLLSANMPRTHAHKHACVRIFAREFSITITNITNIHSTYNL
jgi:hypothetical protein